MRTLALLLCVGMGLSAEMKLGRPLTLKQALPAGVVASAPEKYVGQTVQVKGKVVEVCQKMGCWMNLADPATGKMIRIKVKDGEIVFPKESVGKMAIAEGKMVKIELSREQLIARMKHEAEENGKPFDPATVTSGTTIYQIAGVGAIVLD